MDVQQEGQDARSELEAARFQFISTELDLAMTFCRIALASTDTRKHERNAGYAERAYQAATRFLDESDFTVRERREIESKIANLTPLLGELRHNP